MGSSNSPKITGGLLRSYSEAALRDADDLLVEASLLRDNGHMARAYFLAVACIEEAGKALHTFDSQNRNLADPAARRRTSTGPAAGQLPQWTSSSSLRTAVAPE